LLQNLRRSAALRLRRKFRIANMLKGTADAVRPKK